MSKPLFKITLQKNISLFLVFTGILVMYLTVIISMYTPQDTSALNAMLESIPLDMRKAFGFEESIADLTGLLASWLYGLLMIAFPMVYSIMLGYRLVVKTVDSGSMACLMAGPDSRTKIIVTKMVYGLGSVLLMQAICWGVGMITSEILFAGELHQSAFLRLNIVTAIVNAVVFSLCLFFSCLFNETKRYMSWGAGIPVIMLLLNMMSGVSEKIEFLKYFSVYGYVAPVQVVQNNAMPLVVFGYIFLCVVLSGATIIIFKKRNFPL